MNRHVTALEPSAGVRALASIRKAKAPTWYWFGIYFFAAVLVLEFAIWLGIQWLPTLRELALDYLFPDSWQPLVDGLIDRLFSDAMAGILAAAGMTLGVVVVGITLFPIKEKLSSSFECDAFPEIPGGRELPLIRQGIEELKLLALYAVLQSLSIYAGLQGNAALATVGTVLGYWYLVVAMALDHAAPVFQRRSCGLLDIAWLLIRHVPVSLHLIGFLFALPAAVLALLLPASVPPTVAVTVVVCAEVLGMAFATLAGCALGAGIIAAWKVEARTPRWWKWGVGITTAAILIWQAIFFAWWGITAHHHSQILKCTYSVDWRGIKVDIRGKELVRDRLAVIDLGLPLTVENTTGIDLDIRDALLEVRRSEEVVGTAKLPFLSVPDGEKKDLIANLTLEFPVEGTWKEIRDTISSRGDGGGLLNGLGIFLVVDPPLSTPVSIKIR